MEKAGGGYLMINVDGSFAKITGDGSTGVVIRDASGGFIATSYSYISHVLDAITAKASALRDGLLLAVWHNKLVSIECKS